LAADCDLVECRQIEDKTRCFAVVQVFGIFVSVDYEIRLLVLQAIDMQGLGRQDIIVYL
jgi:hypothetical protein